MLSGGLEPDAEWNDSQVAKMREDYLGSFYGSVGLINRHPALQRAFPDWEDFLNQRDLRPWLRSFTLPFFSGWRG